MSAGAARNGSKKNHVPARCTCALWCVVCGVSDVNDVKFAKESAIHGMDRTHILKQSLTVASEHEKAVQVSVQDVRHEVLVLAHKLLLCE